MDNRFAQPDPIRADTTAKLSEAIGCIFFRLIVGAVQAGVVSTHAMSNAITKGIFAD